MKKIVKWACVVLLSPLALFILLAALLCLPAVQNWAVDKVTAIVSEQTGMQVSIGTVSLKWPLDLGIDGFLVIQQGDTLADVEHLTADVQLRPLFHRRIVLNELSLRQANINTLSLVSDLQVKGHVGELWLRSDGIDLGRESVAVNGARLGESNIDIALSDTAAVDTTGSVVLWRINADSLSVSRTAVSVHLPGDTLHVTAYMGQVVVRGADVDLGTATYQVSSLDWYDGRLAYYAGNLCDSGQPQKFATSVSGFDADHITLSDIRLGVDSIYYGPHGTSLYIRQTAMKERCGLELTQLTTQVRLDTAFTHIEMPHLMLRTLDSDVEAEVYADFNAFVQPQPTVPATGGSEAGKMHLRLNAQIGKQDLMRFIPHLPEQTISRYPNHPLCIRGSINGNIQRMEFTGLDINLPTALHVKAGGFAANVTVPAQLRAQVALKAETHDIGFLQPVLPLDGLRLPPMTLNGLLSANGDSYSVEAVLSESDGTLAANVVLPRVDDLTTYRADIQMRGVNLYHFLPQDKRMGLTADMTADLTLRNGHATGTISGQNALFDGSIGLDALLSSKLLEATLLPQLHHADLYGLQLSNDTLAIGLAGKVSLKSDLKHSHELKGLLTNLYIKDEKSTYHPENLGLLVRTNSDTTLARIQSGDFIVKADVSGGYNLLIMQSTTLIDSITAQFQNRVIDQQAVRRLLPTMRLHVESGHNNPIANILKTKNISFRQLYADITTSVADGINGGMHLYALNYDSTRIDTVRLMLTQKGDRLTYQGQVRNNKKNPQFVFNALIDGHFHEHGALVGMRYYDAQEQMGVRLGVTASMVDNGVLLKLMPERPTIGYKEFHLNKDNYVLLGRNNRLQAKIDLIADDRTGMKIYTSEDQEFLDSEVSASGPADSELPNSTEPQSLQDLTVSLNRINLDELTSVLPYLPRMSGLLNGDFHIVQDRQEHFSVVSDMEVHDMTYERSPIGNLSTEFVYMQREDDGHAIEARLMLDGEEFGLLQGSYYAALASQYKVQGEEQPADRLDATFTMTRLPLSLANGFVPDQIVGLDGYGEGQLTIKGSSARPVVDGELYLDSAFLVSVPYGMRMRFDNDPVRIVGSHLLLENFGIYAYNDEPLNMQGDIDFSDLDHLSMNLRMRARNLQIINARQEPKSIAFGKAFVNLFARLSGPLDALSMRGRLDVLGSTDLTYMLLDSPLSTDNRLDELVKFTDFGDTIQAAMVVRPTPSDMSMDLTVSVSQGAHIVCNLNAEQTNYVDLMGGGDLRMRYGGIDGLTLTGRYTLANGEMKYSMPVIPLKTFTIQDGSYVEFTGDPMNPRLSITATERTKATVAQDGGQGRSVAFDCGVVITKTLSDMGLQFVISAPEDNDINTELQSMSTEERGKLAVTMLTTGMYLADGNTGSFSMNSALSSFLQSEINNITGSALKTLDLSVGLDNTTDASGQMRTDYSFKFSKRLFNNRLKIQLGGKVSSGQNEAPGQQQSFFDNVTMEYRLDQTATKNVKLFYQQNVYDWLDGYTGLYGGGFIWRKKMDSLSDIFHIFSSEKSSSLRPATSPFLREGSSATLPLREPQPTSSASSDSINQKPQTP